MRRKNYLNVTKQVNITIHTITSTIFTCWSSFFHSIHCSVLINNIDKMLVPYTECDDDTRDYFNTYDAISDSSDNDERRPRIRRWRSYTKIRRCKTQIKPLKNTPAAVNSLSLKSNSSWFKNMVLYLEKSKIQPLNFIN